MDLNGIIAELRSELETLNQVMASLEKLNQIRERKAAGGVDGSVASKPKRKPRKGSDGAVSSIADSL